MSINELVKASLRVRAMFLLALCAVIVLGVFCLWVLNGLINQADQDVRSRFQHLTFDLLEQEYFLRGLVGAGAENRMRAEAGDYAPREVSFIGQENGTELYFGRAGRNELPYAIQVPSGVMNAASPAGEGLARLGETLAGHFIRARGARISPESQAFLFDMNGGIDITIPCLPKVVPPQAGQVAFSRCRIAIDHIREKLSSILRDDSKSGYIYDELIRSADKSSSCGGVLLYREIEVDQGLWSGPPSSRRLIVGTYLELAPTHSPEFSDGKVVLQDLSRRAIGVRHHALDLHDVQGEEIHSSNRLRPDGLYVAASSSLGWDAGYLIPWDEFFHAAQWQLIGFAFLVVLMSIVSSALYRRHLRVVVLPAKRAHELVVESAAFSQAVIDVSKVAVVGVSIRTLDIVVRNGLAAEWLGSDECIQSVMLDCVGDIGRQGEDFKGVQVFAVDGRYFSVSSTPTSYRGEDILLAAFSDVTSHHEINAALELARRAADDANAGKTVFLASMSHEIRTPLYGVLGTIELLSLTDLTIQQRAYLDTIQASSSGLLNIIGDILDVSKIESRQISLKVADFDPVQLTGEVARTYAASAEAKGLQLYIIVADDVPSLLLGDELRIKQILGNILSNAIKFSDAGWIRIRLQVSGSTNTDVTLVWEVADTGAGIPPAQIDSLFQPFYQVPGKSRSIQGTGLGLYICRSLCDLMAGEIAVNSTQGRGSTFNVSLSFGRSPVESVSSDITIPSDVVVWVRAPIAELAHNVSTWLRRAGARLKTVTGAFNSESHGGVLVEISPDRMAPVAWSGPRVSCTPAGPVSPQRGMSGVNVNEYALRGIVDAVVLAAQTTGSTDITSISSLYECLNNSSANPSSAVMEDYRPAIGLERLGLRVLVAEDNIVNRALLARQLEQLGCMVTACADGAEVIVRWEEGEFDVLLTDINMPYMDGYELVQELRLNGVNVPIIGVTASTMQEERDHGLSVGLDAWVTKPVDLASLYDALRRACAEQSSTPRREGVVFADRRADEEFWVNIKSMFIDSMGVDIPVAFDALHLNDAGALMSALHRMRGALMVMNFDELAFFSEVLEVRISEFGLTLPLSNAARSILNEIRAVVGSMS